MDQIRVALTHSRHRYVRAVYGSMPAGAVDVIGLDADAESAMSVLGDVDVVHLHWPEWIPPGLMDRPSQWLDMLASAIGYVSSLGRPRLVWTLHNRRAHFGDPDMALRGYEIIARACDAAIHHSAWGERVMRAELPFRDDCIHRVIPHPHFGHLGEGDLRVTREEAEDELGLSPCACRLGCLGNWRPEKRVDMVVGAFCAAAPRDFELLNCSAFPGAPAHGPGATDPRVFSIPYLGEVDRRCYNTRLAAVDALVVAIDADRALTSGVPADAVGYGLGMVCSDWPFLVEEIGDAAIVFGSTCEELEACFASLTPERVAESARRLRAHRARLDPRAVARSTVELLREVIGATVPVAAERPTGA